MSYSTSSIMSCYTESSVAKFIPIIRTCTSPFFLSLIRRRRGTYINRTMSSAIVLLLYSICVLDPWGLSDLPYPAISHSSSYSPFPSFPFSSSPFTPLPLKPSYVGFGLLLRLPRSFCGEDICKRWDIPLRSGITTAYFSAS